MILTKPVIFKSIGLGTSFLRPAGLLNWLYQGKIHAHVKFLYMVEMTGAKITKESKLSNS
jgi:hypothetical protein